MFILSYDEYKTVCYIWLTLAVIVFLILIFVKAPYGRHKTKGWGVEISAKKGWIIMESIPAVLLTVMLVLGHNRDFVVLFFWAIWTAHYVNRAWAWPNRAKLEEKLMPLSVVILAVIFNTVNCLLNGIWLFDLSGGYELSWVTDPRFIFGGVIFFFGMILNIKSDDILFSLRDDGSTGYKIPRGGLFEKVSSPNYLGEIIEWIGFAIATWSLAGFTFAIWTFCNLAPRAFAHHRWYKEEFSDYPEDRKALIPFVI
ncbi:MAG: 3-oxo-5-alpha-steroid 4-dehydrogenase [Candidatus Thermoplasmatota archaeon]|nr:3-oxo-5-alpha-steroid 4-dehydrogenase [Candidatus Thermoplasmatota archaeon]